jgi:hypothetical protein
MPSFKGNKNAGSEKLYFFYCDLTQVVINFNRIIVRARQVSGGNAPVFEFGLYGAVQCGGDLGRLCSRNL